MNMRVGDAGSWRPKTRGGSKFQVLCRTLGGAP